MTCPVSFVYDQCDVCGVSNDSVYPRKDDVARCDKCAKGKRA